MWYPKAGPCFCSFLYIARILRRVPHSFAIVGIPFLSDLCLRAFSLKVEEGVRTLTWLMGRLELFLPVIEFCCLHIGLKKSRRSFADVLES